MKLSVVTVCLPALLLCGNTALSQTFVESDGFLSFEAESGSVGGNWLLSTELDHFSGDSYMVWNGPDLFDSANAGQDTIVYQFQISTPGNYELRWRSRITKGFSNTESNDSWVRFPSGVNVAGEQPLFGWSKIHMGHVGAWYWDAKINDHSGANVRQFFTAGTHTMEVSGRSNGHAIDKMALYRYEALTLSPNDLDSRSGTPQAVIDGNTAAVNNAGNSAATPVASGVNYTPGECRDGQLALPALADAHVVDGSVFNHTALQFSPQPARALLRFDTSLVGAIESASLEMSVEDGAGVAQIEYALLDSTIWNETDNPLNPEPQNVLQLESVVRDWVAGTRYSVALPSEALQTGGQTGISIAAVGAESDVWLSMASRENSLQMPLLLLKGGATFCQDYQSAVAGVSQESTEVPANQGSPENTSSQLTTESVSDTTPPQAEEIVVTPPQPATTDVTPAQETVVQPTNQESTGDSTQQGNTPTQASQPSAGNLPAATEPAGSRVSSGGGSLGLLTLLTLMAGGLLRRGKRSIAG